MRTFLLIAVIAIIGLTGCGSNASTTAQTPSQCAKAYKDAYAWAQNYATSLPTPQPVKPLAVSGYNAVIAAHPGWNCQPRR